MTFRPPRRRGFTVVELIIVLTLTGIMMSLAGVTVGRYFGRSAARRAAQVFAHDLTQARMFAVRSREPVIVRFYEGTLRYEVVTRDGDTELMARRFTGGSGLDLSALVLDVDGDSLVFDRTGAVDLGGAPGPLGTARFEAGDASYTVSFNGLGASKLEAS